MKATGWMMVLAASAMFAMGCGGGGSGGDGPAPVIPAPGPVITGLVVTPGVASAQVGELEAFTAMAQWSDGALLVTSVTWSSSHTGIATVSGSGTASAVTPGITTITATLTSNPAITDSADLTVTAIPQVIYAFDQVQGLCTYATTGGAATIHPLSGTVPAWSYVTGMQPVPGGVYLLNRFSTGVGSNLYYADLTTGSTVLRETYSTFHWSLVADSQGRIYSITNSAAVDGDIWRYTPSTDSAVLFAVSGRSLGFQLAIDASDNIYAAGFLPSGGSTWVTRISAAGTVTNVLNAPTGLAMLVTGGLTIGSDGSIYIGDGLTGGFIYRGRDGNSDGDCFDMGEVTVVSPGFAALFGLLATPDGLLANEAVISVLRDGNADGDMSDGGEMTLWSSDPSDNGWNTACLKIGNAP